MNLLKSTNISDLHFMQSEDEEPPQIQGRPEEADARLSDRKLLDSSLNNHLQSLPKHAFKPYQRRKEPQPEASPNRYEFDFNIAEDNKNLSHSSYDFLRMMGSNIGIVGESSSQMMRVYTPTFMRSEPKPSVEQEQPATDQWLDHDQAHSQPEEPQASPLLTRPITKGDLQRQPPKNETKNIPKNYGKAIITFIEKNKIKVNKLCEGHEYGYNEIIGEFRHRKRSINTIEHLRQLWLSSRYAREMRILSNLFLRKYALQYIFNSRITNYSSHIKYRHKLLEGVACPREFNNIKDY